jgi:hypothetical protein
LALIQANSEEKKQEYESLARNIFCDIRKFICNLPPLRNSKTEMA